MEEFFVKNLENVQGDERDVMIFSVGYGRDAQGKMYQNFGPLNKAGGERRLNVAITRARMHIKLVTSIGTEDVEGSASTGARLLRDYLAYAASGGSREVLQAGQERRYAAEMDTPLEDDVHRALTAEGLKVHRRIGCSGYRIDLAVEDPDRPWLVPPGHRMRRRLLPLRKDGPGPRADQGERAAGPGLEPAPHLVEGMGRRPRGRGGESEEGPRRPERRERTVRNSPGLGRRCDPAGEGDLPAGPPGSGEGQGTGAPRRGQGRSR